MSKTIPRATYGAIAIITVFYFLTTWITVGALGPDAVREFGADNKGDMYFKLSSEYASESLTGIMALILLTSLLASLLALHNAASRYMFNAGREGLLPSWIGVAHRTQGTPSRASLVQTGINVAVILVFANAGADPYFGFGSTMTGVGTLGILLLETLAALAITMYFIRNREKLVYIVAPALALVMLIIVVILTIRNFRTLAQIDSGAIDIVPWALLVVALLGMGYGLWLRASRPGVYAQLGE
ncbi:amino acid permease [Streptomyces sp. MMCC 100]|uniref:amino acid permease n=1 Tax=Streptomyces sp. MMCC 100 TaxID=3163555 RepID=UPI0035983771